MIHSFQRRRFDPERNVIEHDGQEVRLAPKTSDLLDLLVRRRGEVVSREAIADHLWPEVVVGEDALSFQLSALRKALGDAAALLKTVPRRGYVWLDHPEATTVAIHPVAADAECDGHELVGRQAALATLSRHLDAAAAGECQMIVVAGDEGVGKTRLLAEFALANERRGVITLRGRCVEPRRGPSHQGLAECLLQYFQRAQHEVRASRAEWAELGPALVAMFPVLGEIAELRPAAPVSGTQQPHSLEMLARALLRISAGRPLTILLDDVHTDLDSLQTLEFLAHRLRPSPILMAAAARHTDLHQARIFWRLAETVRGERRFGLVELEPFSLEECRSYVRGFGAGDAFDAVAQALFEITAGNPRFLREFLSSLDDRRRSGEDAVDPALLQELLPATIRHAVARRVDELPEVARDVLRAASVFEDAFGHDQLHALVSASPNVERALDVCLEQGFLVEERGDRGFRLRFANRMHREALYASLSGRRRQELHRMSAEELERRYQAGSSRLLPQLVRHYAKAAVASKALEYGQHLIRSLLAQHSYEEAAATAAQVYALFDQESADEQTAAAETKLLGAIASRSLGRFDLALQDVETSISLFQGSGDTRGAGRALLAAAETAWDARRIGEMRAFLARGIALARRSEDEECLRALNAHAATLAALRRDYERAEEGTGQERAERLAIIDIPMSSALESLDPSLLFTVEQGEVIPAIFDPLTHTVGARVVPWLAAHFASEEGGRQFRFVLREGVRFHDGRPLTARDVRFTFERLLANEASPSRSLLSPIRGAEKVMNGERSDLEGFRIESPSEFTIELERPLVFFPAMLAHYATAIVREGSGPDPRVGTGAYRVVHFEPGEKLELRANGDYWGQGTIGNDGLRFTFGVSTADAVSGFRKGRFAMLRGLPPEEIESLHKTPGLGFVRRERLEVATHYLAFNVHSGPMADQSLRKRVSAAIDATALVQRHLGGTAVPAQTLVPPGLILEEMVRRLPPPRRSAPRNEVSLRAIINPVYEERHAAFADGLFASLREAGLEVEHTPMSKEEYHQARCRGAADLALTRWVADYPDADSFYYSLLHSEKGIIGSFCGLPELDELLERSRTESDLEARHRVYREIEALLAERALLLPLFYPQNIYFVRPEIEEFTLSYFAPHVCYERLRVGG